MSRTACEVAPSLPMTAIEAQIGFIEGKVLTVIDASFASPQQNKAIKDLIKGIFRDQHKWISSLAHGCDNGGDLHRFATTQI